MCACRLTEGISTYNRNYKENTNHPLTKDLHKQGPSASIRPYTVKYAQECVPPEWST